MPNWTDEQLAAIAAQEENILVSAAAGSGKTAVLTERIVKKLTDAQNPACASSLLVVTFTNAAAAEMRERITKKLSDIAKMEPENELIRHQLLMISAASITTIHSFCLNMIRENFILAGVDPSFKIADTTENDILKKESAEECLDEMFQDEKYSSDFALIVDTYSTSKFAQGILDIALEIYDFVMSLPDPILWLQKARDAFLSVDSFEDTIYAKIIKEDTKNTLGLIIAQYDTIIKRAENDDDQPQVLSLLKEERETFLGLISIDTYAEFYNFFSNLKFKNFPPEKKEFSPIYREYIKSVREGIKKTIKTKLLERYFNLSPDEQKEAMEKMYPQVSALSEFVKRIILRFNEKKEKRNILNFNDLEHICYRLFVDENGNRTDLAKKTAMRYSEILIDEYQDTSRLQESIFSAIHQGNKLFMVGDIKQSIYRFRNTDPLLFRDKSDSYEKEEGSYKRKILLSKNFRSRKGVLSSVNYIFSRLMSRNVGEIEYDDDEKLYLGAEFYESLNPLPLETEINIIDKAKENYDEETDDEEEIILDLTTAEYEAELVADRIEDLISQRYEISSKEGSRPISYRDIVVLMRKTSEVALVFADSLTKRGIPVFSDVAGGFFNSGEIEIVMSMLKIIDNPSQDIPLISVLRSPIYNFSTNELASIRMELKNGDFFSALCHRAYNGDALSERICSFLGELEEYRIIAKTKPVHELLWEIYTKSGFYDYMGAKENGRISQANLRNLYIKAVEYGKTGFSGLYGFVKFLEDFKDSGSDFSTAKEVSEERDAVRIMSVHKSKGLEFPVVILTGCGRRMNTKDAKKSLLFHHELGFGPKFIDQKIRITYPTAPKSAISSVILKESISEEMRILYVALTRAKEKLIICGTVNNLSRAVMKWCLGENGENKLSEQRVMSAISYLDWIGMCLINHPDAKILLDDVAQDIRVFSDEESSFRVNVRRPKAVRIEKEKEKEAEEECFDDEIISLVKSEYPGRDCLGIPSKITVTELKRRLSEEDSDFFTLYPIKEEQKTDGISPALRGIAYHSLLENIDFSGDVSLYGIKKTIKMLSQKGVITKEEEDCLDAKLAVPFFESDIFKKLRSAEAIEREVMFAIKEEAKRLGIQNSDAMVLVQGVIDLVAVFSDEIIIIDYKTDRGITADEAIERYRVQLLCYKMAAQKLYGKKVTKGYIYLFENGEFAEVDLSGAIA